MSHVIVEDKALEVIEKALNESPKRRFKEAVDLTVVLRGVDLKRDPNAKINEVVELPHMPQNRPVKIAVIGRGDFALKAKEAGADEVLSLEDLESMAGNKKALKKLANRYDFFIAQADLLPKIARIIGPVFGPRNKMPITLPATAVDRLPELINKLRKSVRIRMRDQPLFHVKVGSRDMSPEEILENIKTVLAVVERKYEDPNKIAKLYIKTTMGPAYELPISYHKRR